MNRRKRRVSIGDVFLLAVDRGFAHQTIGVHPRYKQQWIVRVLRRIDEWTSDDAAEIASGSESYTVFIGDLGLAENEGQLRYVGHAALPASRRTWLPLIRGNACHSSHPNRRENWWIDDGIKSRKIGKLSKEPESLTNGTFIPPLALIENINRGWDPNWEFKGEGAVEFLLPEKASKLAEQQVARFFPLFAKKASAEAATDALRERYPYLEIEAFDDDVGNDDGVVGDAARPHMLVVSTTREFTDIDELTEFEEQLESLAATFNGVYDGNEIPIHVKR